MSMLKNMLRRKLHLPPVNEHAGKRIKTNHKDLLDLTVEQSNRSMYFTNLYLTQSLISEQFIVLARQLNESLSTLTFTSPVAYTYNPTEYAFEPYAAYVTRYCNAPKKILFVGMNPGPYGMCQTGVPFGEVNHVRDWLNISGTVKKPTNECPHRRVLGFNCETSEVSGKRLWGYFKEICCTPDNFFKNAFIYNYCPLAFLKDNGNNLTPADMKGINSEATKQLELLCSRMLFDVIKLLQTEIVVGVGRYAENQCKVILKEDNPLGTQVLFLAHPSPRAPGNWFEKADRFMSENDFTKHFK